MAVCARWERGPRNVISNAEQAGGFGEAVTRLEGAGVALQGGEVGREFGAIRKKKRQAGRNSMFAARDTFSYTEEEIADYEREEAADKNKRKTRINLGDPNG